MSEEDYQSKLQEIKKILTIKSKEIALNIIIGIKIVCSSVH
jgi:hypothetical protein